VNKLFSAAKGIILSVAVLSGCGGGDAPATPKIPLETAATSHAEPVGVLAAVKRAAMAAPKKVIGDVDATSLFDWAEIIYPELFPVGPVNLIAGPYIYRYYLSNDLYLAVEGNQVLALGPATGNKILKLGALADFTCAIFPEVCLSPVAVVGPAQSVKTGENVTLDGTFSSDPSGDSVTYRWSYVIKPVGSFAFLSSTTTAQPSFIPDLEGAYTIQLVVNDGRSDSTPVTTVVTATRSNAIPIAVAGIEQTVSTGSTVALNGTLSSDADADLLTYKWAIVSKPLNSFATISGPASSKPIFVADVTGVYKVSLVVSDGEADSTPSLISITAVMTNVAPVAVTGNSQSVVTGTFVFLNGGNSSDPNGDPITYLWSLDSRPSGSIATMFLSTTSAAYFKADLAGSYVASLTVTDGQLNNTKSLTITASGATSIITNSCCKVCTTGKACGSSCISRTFTCRVGGGCAC